jgi:CPA1 family monovalent cation:H+ antiporter
LNFSNLSILTWAGLRGGISIAMALMLPESPYRQMILSGCYFIVIFSIIFQGLTLKKVVAIAVRYKTE